MKTLEAQCEREIGMLRNELTHLKTCQLSYLTLSVTATGVVLGLIRALNPRDASASSIGSGIVFLTPLLILLPFWWAFFDKATTIARIVGYQRVLEACITGRVKSMLYVGWESALRLHRGHPQKQTLVHDWGNTALRIFTLREHHRYWMVVYYTYFWLSVACIASALNFASRADLTGFDLYVVWSTFAFALIGWFLSAMLNLRRVLALLAGVFSYDAQEDRWLAVLKVKINPTALQYPNRNDTNPPQNPA